LNQNLLNTLVLMLGNFMKDNVISLNGGLTGEKQVVTLMGIKILLIFHAFSDFKSVDEILAHFHCKSNFIIFAVKANQTIFIN